MDQAPYSHWRALRPGYFELNKEALNVHLVQLDALPCPSGRLVIRDSNGFSRGPQRAIPVIPGHYQLTATCVEQGRISLLAYLSIEFSKNPATQWQRLSPTYTQEQAEDLPERWRGGFVNRSAYGLMVDEALLKEGLPYDDDHCYSMLCFWQNRIEDTKPDWEGARYKFSPEQDKAPVVIFRTHQMQGLTPIYGELDDVGLLARLHVDLGLMNRLYQKSEEGHS
jgi:hypothetical protein